MEFITAIFAFIFIAQANAISKGRYEVFGVLDTFAPWEECANENNMSLDKIESSCSPMKDDQFEYCTPVVVCLLKQNDLMLDDKTPDIKKLGGVLGQRMKDRGIDIPSDTIKASMKDCMREQNPNGSHEHEIELSKWVHCTENGFMKYYENVNIEVKI